MAQFSKETLIFLQDIGGDLTKLLSSVPTDASRMVPGNVLIFRYQPLLGSFARRGRRGMDGRFVTDQRVILIVRCRRGDGVFPGNDDKLVSCFKLDGSSETVVEAILENLYKKRRLASYYGLIKQSLQKLLGPDSFRTYRLTGMKSLYQLSIKGLHGRQ